MKTVVEANKKRRKKMMLGFAGSGSSSSAPPKYRMVYTSPGVSYADRNSNKIGAITHNSNRGNSSSNSSSSTVLLPHYCSRLPSGHHSSFPPITSLATTVGRWGTLLESAASPSTATHRELRHPWSISRRAIRRILHHGLTVPIIPSWRRFPREKKC
jgi:hypothetical protein